MAKFRVAATVPLTNTALLGQSVANALVEPTTQSVEVVLRSSGYEVRVWREMRDDLSNRINASPNVDYGCADDA